MKHPKDFRQEIYTYIEGLLGRPLTFEEHDELREMMVGYLFSSQNLKAGFGRLFCLHEWTSDKKVESGENSRIYVKCIKCDKRSRKRIPSIAFDT